MKFFASIMALMVLVLSIMPCMDEPCMASDAKANAQISVAHNTKGHSDTDPCSPFCTCNCCAGFAVLLSPVLFQHKIDVPAKFYASYLPSTTIEISLPVWQPPKLS